MVKGITRCQSKHFFHETSKLSNIENLSKFVKRSEDLLSHYKITERIILLDVYMSKIMYNVTQVCNEN